MLHHLTRMSKEITAENHMDDLFASMTTGIKKGQKAKGTSIGQLPYIRLTNKADYRSNFKVIIFLSSDLLFAKTVYSSASRDGYLCMKLQLLFPSRYHTFTLFYP